MELNKYLKKYLPPEITSNFRDTDGHDIAVWLETIGHNVVSNKNIGEYAIAITDCGYVVDSNGYVYIS